MRVRHYFHWLMSSSYRKHYWLGRNLSKYRRVTKSIKALLETAISGAPVDLIILAKRIQDGRKRHHVLTKEIANVRRKHHW